MEKYQFHLKPYAHQKEAIRKSWDRTNFAYLMDMGTGKSKVLLDNIGILYHTKQITAALIVAPKGVFFNWQKAEIPLHLPQTLKYVSVLWNPSNSKKAKQEQEVLFWPDENCLKIFIMNVEAFSTDKGCTVAEKFLQCHKALFAVDESTTIKNRKAQRTKNIIRLGKSAKYRRILTGSPVTNSPMDLYTQCAFLDEKLLGFRSFFSFQCRFAIIQNRSIGPRSFREVIGYQNLNELNVLLQKFSFRIKKEECLDLPDKVYQKRKIDLLPEQKKIYESLRKHALVLFEDGEVTTSVVLTQLLRMQQACSGHLKMDDGTIKTFPTSKLTECMAVLEETDGKVIIWVNFTHDIRVLCGEIAKQYGSSSVLSYYGETSVAEREEAVAAFQNPSSPVRFFVGQSRTGGYGLTLTQAQTVIYYSNNFDLEIRLQSEDRAHRIGQKKSVTYIDIVSNNTVEEKILLALRNKINLASEVLSENFRSWVV